MTVRPIKIKPKVRIPIEDIGAMTWVARRKFKRARVTDIPNSEIPRFVDELVKIYGEKQARGMIRAQLVFRKNKKNTRAYKKFELMDYYIRQKYND